MLFFRRRAREKTPAAGARPEDPSGRAPDGLEASFLDENGLYHRWYLEHRLREEVARAGRTGKEFSLATWHWRLLPNEPLNPDRLTRAVAAILKGLRWYDVAARIDRQRFVAILFDSDYESAATVAYRIKADLQIRLPSAGKWQVGVATFGRDGADEDALLQATFRSLEEDARAA